MSGYIKTILIISLMVVGDLCWAENSEIQKILERYTASINNLDLELASQIWSQTADTSFIHPRGHQKGWEDIKRAFYLGAMANFSKRDLRLKDISIRILSKEVAWADFYWDFHAVFAEDGSAMTTKGRETQIFRKEKEGWKIVHVHYSGPATQREREGF